MAQHGKGCWDVAGIEGEQEFERLLYNRCSGVIITQFRRRAASGVPVSMLYGRSRGGARYAPLFDPNEDLSYEEPASAASAPILICNVLKWDETGGGDWHGVARTDLDTRHVFPLLQERDLPVREPYTSAAVTHIHHAWPDGRGAICTVALSRPATDADMGRFAGTGERFVAVNDYCLCDLDLEEKTYERITGLLNPFF